MRQDFDALDTASSLPTLLKLLQIPSVRAEACRALCAIGACPWEERDMEQHAGGAAHWVG